MKKLVLLVIIILYAMIAVAEEVHCFYHSYATCYFTGETSVLPDGGLAKKYHCTCGDDMWVR
jgi:hypothetical protein